VTPLSLLYSTKKFSVLFTNIAVKKNLKSTLSYSFRLNKGEEKDDDSPESSLIAKLKSFEYDLGGLNVLNASPPPSIQPSRSVSKSAVCIIVDPQG